MKRLVFIFSMLFFGPLKGQSIKVAVAANLQSIIKVLAQDFNQKTGLTIEPIIGASGNLAAQIKNGAPYDLFLSADMNFPSQLYNEGFSSQKPIVYAKGSLIICSNQDIIIENWGNLLQSGKVVKIAIANPKIAPYGKATEEALTKLDILKNIQPKLVYGESISQVNTYITTGVVDIGFTTKALVMDASNNNKLYWKVVDPKLYQPIEQGMMVLKSADGNNSVQKFYQYLLSPSAKAIFEKYGYRE